LADSAAGNARSPIGIGPLATAVRGGESRSHQEAAVA
jgi:hypothetical protein